MYLSCLAPPPPESTAGRRCRRANGYSRIGLGETQVTGQRARPRWVGPTTEDEVFHLISWREVHYAPRTPGKFAFCGKFARIRGRAAGRHGRVRIPISRKTRVRPRPTSPSVRRDSVHPRGARNLDG